MVKGQVFRMLHPGHYGHIISGGLARGIFIADPGTPSKVSMNLRLWMNLQIECGKTVYTRRVSIERFSVTCERLGARMGVKMVAG